MVVYRLGEDLIVKIMILSSYAPSVFFFRKEMIAVMQERGHDVIVAAPERGMNWNDRFEEIGVQYYSINDIEKTGKNPFKDLKGLYSILRLLLEIKPDKVFTYQAKTNIYGTIAARSAAIKEIYVLMGGLGSVLRNGEKNPIKTILKLEYKLTFALSKKIFLQNRDDLKLLLDNDLVKRDKVTMINGSGVNLDSFTEKSFVSKKVFLLIARIIKDKGILEYINAAKIVKEKYPKTRIQLLGYFDTNPTAIKREEIQHYVNEGIIEYLGSTDDVRPYLEKCSVFVLPSYHEGTPKSVLEAMATARPIITTDAPGCRETVIDGVNGFLVPVKSVEKLAEKMIWMIEHQKKAEEMGKEGRRICEDKFDVKKVNKVILDTMDL